MPRAESKPAQGPGFLESASQQSTAYSVLLVIYSVLALTLTIAPEWAVKTWLQVPPTELTTGIMGVVASFMWVAVGAVACLREAALHSRLSSDTYKRLNLGLMYWAVNKTVLLIKFHAQSSNALLGGSLLVYLLTLVVCARTYTWSNEGFDIKAVFTGLFSGIKELFSPKNLMAAFYSVCAVIYLICWCILFPTHLHPLFVGDIGPTAQYLKRLMGAGMLLVGVVHFVLKDAADRGRLGASTFRQLNLTVSLYSIVGGWYFYRMWTGGVPVLEPMMWALLIMSVGTALVCDWAYLFAKK